LIEALALLARSRSRRRRYVGDQPPVSRQSVTVAPQPGGLSRAPAPFRAWGMIRPLKAPPPGRGFLFGRVVDPGMSGIFIGARLDELHATFRSSSEGPKIN
jgi:hypothetical protein